MCSQCTLHFFTDLQCYLYHLLNLQYTCIVFECPFNSIYLSVLSLYIYLPSKLTACYWHFAALHKFLILVLFIQIGEAMLYKQKILAKFQWLKKCGCPSSSESGIQVTSSLVSWLSSGFKVMLMDIISPPVLLTSTNHHPNQLFGILGNVKIYPFCDMYKHSSKTHCHFNSISLN